MMNLIVCSTPQGGHIEHALNLAAAMVTRSKMDVVVLTRSGAGDYMHGKLPERVRLIEIFAAADLSYADGLSKRVRTFMKENYRLLCWSRTAGVINVVLFEEPRFPVLSLVRANRKVLFAHNAKMHASGALSIRTRLKEWLQIRLINSCHAVITHGNQQAKLLSSLVPKSTVATVPLPTIGWVEQTRQLVDKSTNDNENYLLAIGEIRWNKGFDLAARAAVKLGLAIKVAGKVIDADQDEALKSLQESSPDLVHYTPGFLDQNLFESLVRNASVIVLPYREFQAQSGIIEHARRHQKPVVCSDLPSLLEQCGSDWPVWFKNGDSSDLESALLRAMSKEIDIRDLKTDSSWEAVADAVLGETFSEAF
ncbi:hypothetical protein CH289_05605 [Rhodococcus sp. RS1C4]|nr:glycosyltransferase [Rhodococcus sp. RS1C4]OZC56198.1 hypothetical protein CH289_05605 [Rhodococcus sp. RS1C4]